MTGPNARAKAPSDRKIPRIAPFWSPVPYDETNVVKQGTTVADAEKQNNGIKIQVPKQSKLARSQYDKVLVATALWHKEILYLMCL